MLKRLLPLQSQSNGNLNSGAAQEIKKIETMKFLKDAGT